MTCTRGPTAGSSLPRGPGCVGGGEAFLPARLTRGWTRLSGSGSATDAEELSESSVPPPCGRWPFLASGFNYRDIAAPHVRSWVTAGPEAVNVPMWTWVQVWVGELRGQSGNLWTISFLALMGHKTWMVS